MTKQRVTRQDLESAFSQAFSEGETAVRSIIPQAVVVGTAVVVAAVAFAYLAGRRRGRRRSSVIEIRRV